ncbi:hypothetical protein ACFV3R_32980 [Streptomyces sp. NPDC059740]
MGRRQTAREASELAEAHPYFYFSSGGAGPRIPGEAVHAASCVGAHRPLA